MGSGYSSSSFSQSSSTLAQCCATVPLQLQESHSNSLNFCSATRFLEPHLIKSSKILIPKSPFSAILPLKCAKKMQTQVEDSVKPIVDPHDIDPKLLQKLSYDALVFCSLRGLVVGDRNSERSGTVPGVGMVHAPVALLPMSFPESQWNQACEVAPIFNELVDRVSQDGEFLQQSLSRTKKVDPFTSRLLEIHSKMLQINKKEEIRLGLHRSDYMLDEQTKLLLQIELNTISSSFSGLSCLVSELHRSLLHQYSECIALDPNKIPTNNSVNQFTDALAKAWNEYGDPRAVVMFVILAEERNMYDQHWLSASLGEKHQVTTIRKTLAEIDAQGELLEDGTLIVDGEAVAVIYFRAGYAPSDYHSESAWKARLLMEQSRAVKCPSISYHLAGTKKIQQELAKPNVLERFLENKDDIAKLRKCFAGLWSLDESDTVKDAIERPGLYVMKPQREGGGNNIYGEDVKEALLKLQKEGTGSDAFILMQRIFPTVSHSILMREGIPHKEQTISELGIYGTYLRNEKEVLINQQSGYLMRTKVSSSNEGGVAAGFAVLDSIYLV
ncbi:glutathione synthetase, chloroplastic [Nicotiana tabacum]|uniref:Glutathione synthetase n=3 Tax=Nicotiana TaxID=4085 RepID=A0A077D837_TOBAC|nr:glutathione synthetase, chloroplastic [Nicotiana tabacum]XP_009773603.1 PREDICTED: glutathione synthetase, chloroplastic [Nicotiana sylvestris]AIL30500.1 glutathione synthetase [Nicotiana tabacum]